MSIIRVVLYSLLLSVLFSASSLSAASNSEEKPARFILIHLDSVSSHYLQSEMEAGNLPYLKQTFESHGMILGALTYFPSKTPTVISNLRKATPVSEGILVGWSGTDDLTGKVITKSNTFIRMLFKKPRLAFNNIIYGTPLLDRLGGVALGNLPELIDDYRVLEFYWYSVDTYGHFFGEDAYLRKLRSFDRQFGKMVRRLDEDVNIIIYADHGMVFGEGIETDAEIKELLAEKAKAVSYPEVYLADPGCSDVDELAKTILQKTGIDFTFFKSCEARITGYHEQGTVYIEGDDAGIRYHYEGKDPFGYYEAGYNGETLTSSQWLQRTHNMRYPAVPVNLYNLMLNSGSGEIITLLDEGRFSESRYNRKGNHGGFTRRDLSVPLLLRGPDLEVLYDRETMWLQNLFNEIGDVEFYNTPPRDGHYLNWWHNIDSARNVLQLSFSPRYRWGFGGEVRFAEPFDADLFQGWVKFDLLRGYISRLWVGTGVEAVGGDVNPMAFLRHELRYRKLTARSTLSTTGNHDFALEFRLADPLSIQVVNFNSAGLRLHF